MELSILEEGETHQGVPVRRHVSKDYIKCITAILPSLDRLQGARL
jgi:hypothetical protein